MAVPYVDVDHRGGVPYGRATAQTLKLWTILRIRQQSIYLENLHRQPDSYGIEYYCKKVESGQMTISEIRHRMARSPEGRLRKEAALVDDYLDQVFGSMPALLGGMCRTFNSRMCTPSFKRQLTVMLYKGQVRVACVAQMLQLYSMCALTTTECVLAGQRGIHRAGVAAQLAAVADDGAHVRRYVPPRAVPSPRACRA